MGDSIHSKLYFLESLTKLRDNGLTFGLPSASRCLAHAVMSWTAFDQSRLSIKWCASARKRVVDLVLGLVVGSGLGLVPGLLLGLVLGWIKSADAVAHCPYQRVHLC